MAHRIVSVGRHHEDSSKPYFVAIDLLGDKYPPVVQPCNEADFLAALNDALKHNTVMIKVEVSR